MGDLTKHFSLFEFKCPCCRLVDMDIGFVRKLETLRMRVGFPITISSGYRCEKHNKEVGGVSSSAHRKGVAADIFVHNDEERFHLLSQIFRRETWWTHKPLFNRVGIGKHFIHIDVDESKDKNRTWAY